MATTANKQGERLPYWPMFGVVALVLGGYVWTLAPTVTFWDAGELIATSKILGIPHPPGTPLFVLLGNVWAALVPIGGFAYRTNLMTAAFSAAAAGFFFLLIARALRGAPGEVMETDRIFTIGGAAAAAFLSAFVFTVWQNSNETEVYMVATLSIAAICWLAWLWRAHRGEPRAPHLLLLIMYLAAVSLGTHLLTLLVGPPLIGYMAHVLRTNPLPDERDRKIEWAQWAVLAGAWALLMGTGLGSTNLMVLGGIIFLGAAGYATRFGGFRFGVTVLLIMVVGASTYLFLYLRARVGPFINEADPSTLENLIAVIRREQYPPRSPIDNPIFPSGPGNPGRSLTLILLQIQNYLQYFDWQWAKGLAPSIPAGITARMPFTLLFTGLGIYGATVLRERDRSIFWLVILVFVVTGPGLMGYMNFKPGFSLGWDLFPTPEHHEVRERDYFFTVSFQAWGLLAGIGLAGLYRSLRQKLKGGALPLAPAAVLLGGLAPFALNFGAASRAHGPDARLARDFSYDLLQSVEPYGIVFTNGDNDTFPLWYLQEVEGVRQDVSVVNLSLGNTDWYLRQLRDNPVRGFDPEQAPWFAPLAPSTVPGPLHSMTDEEIAGLRPDLLRSPLALEVGRIRHTYEEGTPIYVKDVLILRLILENWRERPMYFSLTAGQGNWLELDEYLTQQGLVLELSVAEAPDTSRLAPGLLGVPVDIPRSDSLVTLVYRYADLLEADTLDLDPTSRNIATNLSYASYSLGQAYAVRGERDLSLFHLSRAYHLSPIAQLGGLLDAMATPPSVFADTPITP